MGSGKPYSCVQHVSFFSNMWEIISLQLATNFISIAFIPTTLGPGGAQYTEYCI